MRTLSQFKKKGTEDLPSPMGGLLSITHPEQQLKKFFWNVKTSFISANFYFYLFPHDHFKNFQECLYNFCIWKPVFSTCFPKIKEHLIYDF